MKLMSEPKPFSYLGPSTCYKYMSPECFRVNTSHRVYKTQDLYRKTYDISKNKEIEIPAYDTDQYANIYDARANDIWSLGKIISSSRKFLTTKNFFEKN